MNPAGDSEQKAHTEESQTRHRTGLVTLLFTDMVGSTALKQRLGDRSATAFFDKHHQIVRQTLAAFASGREIQTAGDSFLLTFDTPSDAVQFALLLQSRLRTFAVEQGTETLDRIGVHVGEVLIKKGQSDAQPKDLYGIQIDTCSRVMSLAQGGQVLMTRAVFDSARQVLKGEDIEGVGTLEWLNHGPYLLKGLDEPVEICQVCEAGQMSGGPPASSEKAQRKVSADEEPILGWRPAIAQRVPNTHWRLEKKLGEGGFGEVWLGRNPTTKEARVFKFCFHAERVRFLKRELTLFRLLKERVGDHPNIVRLHDVYLEHPPFYVEMDYVEGADLRQWFQTRGAEQVPVETRLEIVAQVADALQAAHDSGVIHRDVKPANILLHSPLSTLNSQLIAKLTDFGIGQVVSDDYLKGITKAGFTQTLLSSSSSSHTGTQMYMAPELLAGKAASTRSDIYSLGVVLYQLLVNDFTRPVTTDWARGISDTLLREDLQGCFAGEPQDRFGSASELAKRLRAVPERRAELTRREAEQAALERAAYRRGIFRTAGLAAVLVLIFALLSVFALRQSRMATAASVKEKQERVRAEAGERTARQNLYAADMLLAGQGLENEDRGRAIQLLQRNVPLAGEEDHRGWEWRYFSRATRGDDLAIIGRHQNSVRFVNFSPDGRYILSLGNEDALFCSELGGTQKVAGVKNILGLSRDMAMIAGRPAFAMLAWAGTNVIVDVLTVPDLTPVAPRIVLPITATSPPAGAAEFGQDAKQLLIAGAGWLAAFDLSGGKELWRQMTPIGSIRQILSRESNFSQSARLLAIVAEDRKRIVLWNYEEKRAIGEIGYADEVAALAFSRSGNFLAVADTAPQVTVWEIHGLHPAVVLAGGEIKKWTVALRYSPDDRILAGGSYDQILRLWDTSTWKEAGVLRGHENEIWDVDFSPDGKQLVTGGKDETVRLWPAQKLAERDLYPFATNYVGWAIAQSGRFFLEVLTNEARLVSVADLKVIRSGAFALTNISNVAIADDGSLAAFAQGAEAIRIFETERWTERVRLELPWPDAPILEFSPDSAWLAAATEDGRLSVWKTSGGPPLWKTKAHSRWIDSLSFSPDSARLATSSDDRTAAVWRTATGERLARFEGHKHRVTSAVFSPDGAELATSSIDGTSRLWDAAQGTMRRYVRSQLSSPWNTAFTPDGRTLVIATGDGPLRAYNHDDLQEVAKLGAGTLDGAHFVRFLDENTLMAMVTRPIGPGRPAGLRLWRAASKAEVASQSLTRRAERP